MTFDPLEERGLAVEKQLRVWRRLNSTPYDTAEKISQWTDDTIAKMSGKAP